MMIIRQVEKEDEGVLRRIATEILEHFMKIFEINIQEPYYSYVVSGEKSVEGRLNKGKFKEIQTGDFLLVNNEHKFEVIKKNSYKSFKEMIEKEKVENVIPDKDNIEDAVDVYYKFYTKEQEEEFGVVAIKIKKA